MKFSGNFLVRSWETRILSILKSRLCQLPYCMRVLKTSRRWGSGEQLGVMYDIKSGVVSLDYYN